MVPNVPPEFATSDSPSGPLSDGGRPLDSLPEAAERFRAVFDQGSIGVVIAGPDYSFIEVNDRFCAMLGYTREELLTLRVADFTHPDDYEFDRGLALRLAAGEIPSYQIEKRYVRKDGEVIWGELSGSLVRDAEGAVLYAVGMITDITARKQAEDALRLSEERLRTLVAPRFEAVIVHDNGTILDANDTLEELSGYTRDEFIGRNALDFIDEADRERIQEHLISPTGSIVEAVCIRKDGQRLHLEMAGSDFTYQGRAVRVVSARDVTARKQAEQELPESEEHFRLLAENSMDVIIEAASDGTFVYVSKNSQDILGFTPEELIGTDGRQRIHPEDLAKAASVLEGAGQEGAGVQSVLRWRVKSGEWRWFEWRARTHATASGERRLLGVVRDVTERRAAEHSLRESEARWRSLTEDAPDVILTVDIDGVIQWANVPIAGGPLERAVGTSVFDYVQEEHVELARNTVRDVVESGEPRTIEVMGLGPGEALAWYSSLVGPITVDGQVTGVTVVSRDITEQKQAAEKLQKSESTNRALLASMPDMIFRMARDGAYLEFMPGVDSTPLVPPEEFIGRNIKDVFPELAEGRMQAIERALATGMPQSTEYHLERDGELLYFEARTNACGEDEVLVLVRDVTKRKQAELELQKSETTNRALLASMPDMIFRIARDGTFLEFMPGVDSTPLIPPEEIIGRNVREVLPELAEDRMQAIEQALTIGKTQSTEYELEYKGEHRWFESRLHAFGPDEVLVVARDVTARHGAAEGLRLSERRYRLLADNSLDLIVESTLDGRLTYVSPNSMDIVGYTPEEIVSVRASDLLHPDEVDPANEETGQAIAEGRVARYVHRLQVKSGEWRWFEGLGKPVVSSSGETRMLISYRDITERKRAAQKLRESEERYRVLYTRTPAMLHSTDTDGCIIAVNDCWLRTLGYERDEVLGRKATDFQTEESRILAETVVLPRFWQEGAAQEVPLQFLTKQGDVVEVLLSAIVEHDVAGNVVETLAVLNDVTERRNLEAALVSAREELEGKVEHLMQRRNPYKLTFRELTILHLLVAGRADKEIAAELVISRLTAQKHVSNILGKMNASSRTEAATRALREGLLD